ncbi:MAG: GNAT family N-acetyltransferase [Lachnospiraceae bacterium]|nr:GNAT family N-acetyltransferase [Lachnospiraceae bacterium]
MEYKEFRTERMQDVYGLYERAGWKAYLGDRDKLFRTLKQSLYILGAFKGARLVGFIRCVGDGEHIVYVQDLIVDTEFKRQKIGKTLLKMAMEKYADVRMFTLLTDAQDEESNAFYRAVGMKTCEEHGLRGYFR